MKTVLLGVFAFDCYTDRTEFLNGCLDHNLASCRYSGLISELPSWIVAMAAPIHPLFQYLHSKGSLKLWKTKNGSTTENTRLAVESHMPKGYLYTIAWIPLTRPWFAGLLERDASVLRRQLSYILRASKRAIANSSQTPSEPTSAIDAGSGI